jgi:hypothetical protein
VLSVSVGRLIIGQPQASGKLVFRGRDWRRCLPWIFAGHWPPRCSSQTGGGTRGRRPKTKQSLKLDRANHWVLEAGIRVPCTSVVAKPKPGATRGFLSTGEQGPHAVAWLYLQGERGSMISGGLTAASSLLQRCWNPCTLLIVWICSAPRFHGLRSVAIRQTRLRGGLIHARQGRA